MSQKTYPTQTLMNMNDPANQSREQLLQEVASLRCRVAELEASAEKLKQSAERLWQSETLFHSMFARHAAVMLLIEPTTGAIIEANLAAELFYGYPVSQLCTMNIADLNTLPPDEIRLKRQNAVQEKYNYFVFPHRLAKGEIRTVEVHASPIVLDTQPVLFSIIHDITERKQAEERLHRQNEYLAALYQITLDWLNRREISDLLQAIVESAATLLDAPYAEVMLKAGDELIVSAVTQNQSFLHGERVNRDEARLSWQVCDSGQPVVLADYATWPDHRPVYDHLVPHAIADVPIMSGQTCLGVLALGRMKPDYPFTPEQTQQAILLTQLAALVLDNAALHQAAQHELAERKQAEAALRQANAELQAQNAELDAFARTVAHDLKSPIGVLTGLAEIVAQDHATLSAESLSDYLSSIARSGRKAGQIIEALLLLARMRRQPVRVEPLDMAAIVAEAQQRLAGPIAEHQAEIILPATWPVALGYAPWIEEVWVNYLSNGLKYGGQPPRLVLGAVELTDGQVQFWVWDNGPGLSPEARRILFTEFVRLEPGRANGYGLGLSIVRRVIEKLGGRVEVESEGRPGQGCIFSFTLPAL